MASNTETDEATIYVPLLDEGVDVWRPVKARRLANDDYLILDQDYDRSVEAWAFEPGTVVRCRPERRDGLAILVATAAARQMAPGEARLR
jgi:hypothetical protein